MLRRSARVLAIGAALTMVPLAVTSSADAARTVPLPSSASPSTTGCLPLNPTDSQPAARLRGPDSWRSGHTAVAALGTRVSQAAALNNDTAAGLTALLESDSTAHLDGCSRVVYVEPPQPSSAAGTVAAAGAVTDPAPGTVTLAQAFSLNSRPESTRTILLDFRGGTYDDTWLCTYATAPCVLPAYTMDSDASAFSAAELVSIYRIWQAVSEDFAPFDVNITTQDTGPAAIDRSSKSDVNYGTRIVITSDKGWTACPCGGMARLSSWPTSANPMNMAYEHPPAIIVSAKMYDGGTKTVAEGTSHELGHVFGLHHDGRVAVGATARQEYYYGQGSWAPIMGVGYVHAVSQWSKGEYAHATTTEDDTAIIAQSAPLLADEVGDSADTATPLVSGSPFPSLITSPTDSDWFSFSSRGVTQVSVATATTSADLDVRLDIFTASGHLETWNPTVPNTYSELLATTTLGLAATRPMSTLKPGTYYARVTGTGQGDPVTTGYSRYGSLGRYTITMTTHRPGPPLVITTKAVPPLTLSTAYAAVLTATGGGTSRRTWRVSSGKLPAGVTLSTSGRLAGRPTVAGRYVVTVRVTNPDGFAAARILVMTAAKRLAITSSATLTAGHIGHAYSVSLAATGGYGVRTWTLASGVLPAGLRLSVDGVVFGIASRLGTSVATVRVRDAGGRVTTKRVTIAIRA